MSYTTHILVCFAVHHQYDETITELAARHLACLEEREQRQQQEPGKRQQGLTEAAMFLRARAAGRGFSGGTQGSLFLWGGGFSHLHPRTIVDVLRPFWEDLFTPTGADAHQWGGLLPGDSVVVWFEGEDGERAGSIEIGFGPAARAWWARTPEARRALPPEERPHLRIREREGLPFSLKWDGRSP